MENPAVRLREDVRRTMPGGMLRYDLSGRALLVSDALRAGRPFALPPASTHTVHGGLLYIDLPDSGYDALLSFRFWAPGGWHAEWFAEQSLLQGILSGRRAMGDPDKPLLRAAMIACAMGDAPIRAFLRTLRGAHAAGLRQKSTHACHAAASLCAQYLHAQRSVGLPERCGCDILFPYTSFDFR